MRVIGTAGHVDHGKTALVTALTGINPDRLKEEQEREMTIDLGFAWITLPDGEEIGIIDVPGHRDFIENMLAGVGGIDAALLVIAADEGVMPQTREHLAILDLLQIQSGIVVLTKIDLIQDPDWLDLVEADIRKILKGTILQEAAIIRVSSRSKAGFPDLIEALSAVLIECPPRLDVGRPRLPVDRVFSIAGFGTVVTGTLLDGQLRVGDEVEILPSNLRGRIRGLQTHKKKEEMAIPGSRTAVNISGVNVEQIQRGNVIVHSGDYRTTRLLDVKFRLLADVSGSLQHSSEVKLFIGSSETIAKVRLLDTEILEPGHEGWLQLNLRHPVVTVRGDRYILRRPSPGETLGGGMVADPHPKKRHKRYSQEIIKSLEALDQGSPADVLLQANLTLGPAIARDVVQRARLADQPATSALQELTQDGRIVQLEQGELVINSDILIIPTGSWSTLKEKTGQMVAAYHQNFPLRFGIPREELKSRLKVGTRVFNASLKKMIAEGTLIESRSKIAQPKHEIKFTPEQQVAVKGLLAKFAASPYTPPTIKDCQEEIGEEVFNALSESGDLVVISTEVVFRKKDYEAMVARIRDRLQEKGTITAAEVRDIFNTSRRYAISLLEHLDTSGITMREGDMRRLKSR